MNDKDAMIMEEQLKQALSKIIYPGFDLDIMAMGLVEEARVEGKKAIIKIKTVDAPPEVREALENAIASQLSQIAGVEEMELVMPEAPKAPQKPEGPKAIEGVKAVVPVASGKGGVGKSTVAVNLAVGLAKKGLKVGLLDLDLYGPSIPLMMGLTGAEPGSEGEQLAPIEAFGVKAVSIGFLMPPDKALIWRGPLIMKAVRQLLHEVAWAPLDVLVIDLPPGTGDVQISMAQEVPVTGCVVVSTPQEVALVDAIKAVDMFKAVNAEVFGLVENMSYFVCDECNKKHDIFGNGSVKPLAEKLGVDFLGELPLDPSIVSGGDQGRPAVLRDTAISQAYRELVDAVAEKLESIS